MGRRDFGQKYRRERERVREMVRERFTRSEARSGAPPRTRRALQATYGSGQQADGRVHYVKRNM